MSDRNKQFAAARLCSSSPVRHAELAAPDTPLVALEDSHQPEIFGPQLGRLVQAAGRYKLVTG
jgi:hypothetical protein